jgi:hypothetical protein
MGEIFLLIFAGEQGGDGVEPVFQGILAGAGFAIVCFGAAGMLRILAVAFC